MENDGLPHERAWKQAFDQTKNPAIPYHGLPVNKINRNVEIVALHIERYNFSVNSSASLVSDVFG
jgi:hypothetical protein